MLCLDAIEPMSAVYRRNSRGPSTEPCGTPHRTGVNGDVIPANRTDWKRSERQGRIQGVRGQWSPKRLTKVFLHT